MKTIEEYALGIVTDGAESMVEDDMDEDGDLPGEEEHEKAVDLAYALIRVIREQPGVLLELVKGEREPHNEAWCHRCKRAFIHWSAPSPLWNQVVRGGGINGDEVFQVLCPCCFMDLAEEQGVAGHWRLYAVDVHEELQTVTPSGRVFNDQTWMFEDPQVGTTEDEPADEKATV